MGPFDIIELAADLLGPVGRRIVGAILLLLMVGWARHWPLAYPAMQWVFVTERQNMTDAIMHVMPTRTGVQSG